MFYFGAIAAAFLSAAVIGRYGIERVLTMMLLAGGVCIMVTGVAALSVISLSLCISADGIVSVAIRFPPRFRKTVSVAHWLSMRATHRITRPSESQS
jgi:hypothetical protein